MSNAPGHVSTEPLLGTPGNTFNPPALSPPPKVITDSLRLAPGYLPPAPSPNLRSSNGHAGSAEAVVSLQATVIQPAPPPRAETAAMHDWTAQLEQLRNDVFGIAMSVSALRDRMDRLEQKVSAGDQAFQTNLLKMRGEVEVWLESHLNAAVEHCMQRIITRANSPVSNPAS